MQSEINDILVACNGAVKKVIKVTEKQFNENSDGTVSWNEWLSILKKRNIKNSFWINGESKNKMLNYIFYADFDAGVYAPLYIPVFSRQLIEFQIDVDDNFTSLYMQIKSLEKHQNKCIKESDWIGFYTVVPTTFSLIDFNKRALKIEDDKLLEVFKSVYINIDYNCNNIDKKLLIRLKSLKKSPKNNRKITIYRGQGEFSPNLNSVYSWTTSKEIALKFALMRKNPKCLYRAKIFEKDIITRIYDKDEKEVIALPEDVMEVELIDFDESSKDIAIDVVSKYINKYKNYEDVFYVLKESGFPTSNDSEHSLTHAARVLFYSLMISDELRLNESDRKILNYCSIYHDLGRDNNYEDSNHGKKSLEIIDDLGLPDFDMKLEDFHIANTIIEYHCKSDESGINKLNSLNIIRDKARAINLYKIFKDLDALDRVRFYGCDLNVKYFRFEKIKRKLLVAASLNYYGVDTLIIK